MAANKQRGSSSVIRLILVVLGAFYSHFLSCGAAYSVGVYIVVFLKEFRKSSAVTAWVGSLNLATLCLAGAPASILINRFGSRITVISGSVLACIGLIGSGFSPNIYCLFIFYGIITGLGYGLIFTGCVVVIAAHFEHWRGLAMGISLAGIGLGTFVFPFIYNYLILEYGWRGGLLISSGLALNGCVGGALMGKPRHQATEALTSKVSDKHIKKRKKLVEVKIFRKVWYWLLHCSNLLFTFGFSTALTHIVAYAFSAGCDNTESSSILAAMGASNLVGRIVLGLAASQHRVNTVLLYISCYVMAGFSMFILHFWVTYVGILVIMCVFGFVSSAYGPVMAEVTLQIVGQTRFSTAYGFLLIPQGIGMLMGAPAAGLLYDVSKTYSHSFILGGASIVAAALIMMPHIFRCALTKKDLQIKKTQQQIKPTHDDGLFIKEAA